MPGVGSSSALSGLAERLAGIPSADEIDRFKFSSCDIVNISVPLYVRPMLCEYLSAKSVHFYLPLADHPGAVQPNINTTHTAE
jgi:hypothetical protein